jgi:hypothetical protein
MDSQTISSCKQSVKPNRKRPVILPPYYETITASRAGGWQAAVRGVVLSTPWQLPHCDDGDASCDDDLDGLNGSSGLND